LNDLFALEKGKSIIVCLNKVDLLKDKLKTDRDRKEWIQDLRIDIPWLEFCDLIPISAKYNKGLKSLRNALTKTIFIRKRTISTADLNQAVYGLVESHPIVVKKSGGKTLKVKYSSMIKSSPPTFLLFANRSQGIPENYKRYLKNGLRRSFELDNTPIHIIFRTGKDLEKRMKKVVR
jgi:GTP-binding protein